MKILFYCTICLFLISVDGFLLHYLNRFTPFCLPYWRGLRILRFPAVWIDTPVRLCCSARMSQVLI